MFVYKNKLINLSAIVLLIFASKIIAGGKAKTYGVNFDNTETQAHTLDVIEKELTDNSVIEEDLKVLFFSAGKALRLDADAIPGVKIKYQDTDSEIRSKVETLKNKGVRFILCDRAKQDKKTGIGSNKVTIKSSSSSDTRARLAELESQGFSCFIP